MRSTRRRKPRYEMTCAITDSVSSTGRPARIGRSKRVRVEQREAGHRAAERERAGVAHDDARGCRVPPEEARTRAEHRGGDDRQVERLRREHAVELGVAELREGDDHERGEHECRRTGREPVEPVGEVHRVRGGVDDEDRPA